MRTRWLLVLIAPALAGPALAAGCVPSCDVAGAIALFAPPTLVVDLDSAVTWKALDVPHTATADDGSRCFDVPFTTRTASSASFHVRGVSLFAVVGSTAKECTGAVAGSDGSFTLPYECLYHRNMVGTLVIKPGVAQ